MAESSWTVTCSCGKTVLSCRGEIAQVAICHCVDCRKANGGKDYEVNALYHRRQVSIPTPPPPTLKLLPDADFKYMVPRYICSSCNSCLLADVSLCKDANGYPLAMTPIEYIPPAVTKDQQYHIHVDEATVAPADDGLAKYESHPAGDHKTELSAAIAVEFPE